MIATAGADLETETCELEKVNHRVDEAVAEGNRRLNAFRTFSAVHVKQIAGAVRRVRELLADLQGKECARAVVKKTVSAAPCPGTRGDLGTRGLGRTGATFLLRRKDETPRDGGSRPF